MRVSSLFLAMVPGAIGALALSMGAGGDRDSGSGAGLVASSGESPGLGAVASISEMLDDFHDAAARADAARYFGHFTERAVFLGTDPGERWPLAEFRAWAAPYFEGDSAWTYHAVERHVDVAPCGEVGWFDEVVRNAKYGDLRGTGVVQLEGGRWRIAQYNLTFLIPNEDAGEVLELIRKKDGAGR